MGSAAVIIGQMIIAAVTTKEATETKKQAKQQQRTKDAVAAANARAQFIQERRVARLQRARASAAAAASGAVSSTFLGDVLAITTGEEAAMANIERNMQMQMEQNRIEKTMLISRANAEIGAAIGTFIMAVGEEGKKAEAGQLKPGGISGGGSGSSSSSSGSGGSGGGGGGS